MRGAGSTSALLAYNKLIWKRPMNNLYTPPYFFFFSFPFNKFNKKKKCFQSQTPLKSQLVSQ